MSCGRLVLGFDTAAGHCAAALIRGDAVLASADESMARGQAERLIPLLEEVLAAGDADWAGLDALGVGIGPGNFTGIRIAVAAARGLALGLGIPAEGVTAPEALALGQGKVTVALPAPRGQVYLAHGGEIVRQAADTTLPDGWPARIVGPGADRLTAQAAGVGAPLAASIARIAAGRAGAGRPRPAPLYLRPAAALPASDPPPRLIPDL